MQKKKKNKKTPKAIMWVNRSIIPRARAPVSEVYFYSIKGAAGHTSNQQQFINIMTFIIAIQATNGTRQYYKQH